MRLIDADKLLELIKEQKEREKGAYTKGINAGLNIVKSIINDETQTPTACDVDKVLEQLEEESYERFGNDGMGGELVVNLDDAIEIIKGGGENE